MLDGVTDSVLDKLTEEHRKRIKEIVEDNKLVLIRQYDVSGKSSLKSMKKLPKDEKYHPDNIKKLLSGKKGSELKEAFVGMFPELSERVEGISTHGDYKKVVDEQIQKMSPDDKDYFEAPLPTGIDRSITAIFPEVIFIPAVKDLADEIKTKETTSFGKILRVLLDLISKEDDIKQIDDSFNRLKCLLNIQKKEDGAIIDERLTQVKDVEETLNKLLKEQFPSVNLDLEIPPPELRTVLSGARIYINDGIRDVVETKGDGIKRALTFALLRSYVEINSKRKKHGIEDKGSDSNYLFLFEEPELYLTPKAQKILYDALGQISKEHQVCVTTHSPYFLSPNSTEMFLRFQKNGNIGEDQPPYTIINRVDLSETPNKDAFQIICYENNAAAFFSDQVVLCEGDSDLIFLKHVSRTLNPEWDFDTKNVVLIQIGGKGNIAKYRSFFNCFGVSTQVIADLDLLLENFDGIDANEDCKSERGCLLNEIDKHIDDVDITLNSDVIKLKMRDKTIRERYERAKEIAAKVSQGGNFSSEEAKEFGWLLEFDKESRRYNVLKENKEIKNKLINLLNGLRDEKIHIFLRGSIEDYYPKGSVGRDKPSRAISACNLITSIDLAESLSDKLDYNGESKSELRLIFERIFSSAT